MQETTHSAAALATEALAPWIDAARTARGANLAIRVALTALRPLASQGVSALHVAESLAEVADASEDTSEILDAVVELLTDGGFEPSDIIDALDALAGVRK